MRIPILNVLCFQEMSFREESQRTVHDYHQLIAYSQDKLHPHHWLLVQARFHILTNEQFDKVEAVNNSIKVEHSR